MVLSLFGCNAKPAETTAPPTEPTEPPAEEVYAEARAPLDNASDLSPELLITTTTTVAGDEFSEQSTHMLTYRAGEYGRKHPLRCT